MVNCIQVYHVTQVTSVTLTLFDLKYTENSAIVAFKSN
jgi:hypothetical protein